MATQSVFHTGEFARTQRPYRRALFPLLGLGILLEALYIALYPLLMASAQANDPVRQALPGIFPWLSRLDWTKVLSPQLLARVPWLNPTQAGGDANLLLLLLALATIFSLLAAYLGRRVGQGVLFLTGDKRARAFFWSTIILTVIFEMTMLFAPVGLSVLSRDMLLYGLYGRVVVVYHANPYVVAAATFPHDMLQGILGSVQGQSMPVAASGPLWIDLSILVTLFAHDSIANVLIGFRLIGFVAHLVNVILIWAILAKLKPELRLAAALLYGWNPLVLLLSISQMHLVCVSVLFILLAVLFIQHHSPVLSWVLTLLAVLVNLCFLLLLPLFFRLLLHQVRFRPWTQRMLWWLGMVVVTALFVVLAYAPYWRGWGIAGIGSAIRQIFWPDQAVNSLDAALLSLPIQLPAAVLWLFAPHHWTIAMLVIEALFLLFALWLADTIEEVLLCTSWLFMLVVILHPVYWPWYLILPLALALGSAHRDTILLAVLLMAGALLSYFFLQWQPSWPGQGLLAVGVPLLLWGWLLFFTSLWNRTRAQQIDQSSTYSRNLSHLSRPPWLSRPSWPSRPDSK